jgi:hypothetical protein
MTCTLDLYTDYLISSTGQTSATGLSRLLDGAVSHDQVTRWLTHSYLDSRQVWAAAKPLIRRAEQQRPADEFAVLIVDDSLLEKAHTDPSALICTHWDHSQGRFVKGLNFVSLLYQAGGLAVPIAVELIEKTEAVWDTQTQRAKRKSKYTKNEYLRAMLRVAQPQVAYRYLLADSWYASAENLNAVLALGHDFVMALESSRTVALSEAERAQGRFHALDTLSFPDEQPLRVWLRSVQPAVLVTRQLFTNKDGSQGVLYLVSSDTSLTHAQLTTIYQRRWKVEHYHKSLKQNASMGKSPTKTPDTQANHFFAAILAYTKLEVLKLRHGLGHFRLKAQLYLTGLKASHQQLALFTA